MTAGLIRCLRPPAIFKISRSATAPEFEAPCRGAGLGSVLRFCRRVIRKVCKHAVAKEFSAEKNSSPQRRLCCIAKSLVYTVRLEWCVYVCVCAVEAQTVVTACRAMGVHGSCTVAIRH